MLCGIFIHSLKRFIDLLVRCAHSFIDFAIIMSAKIETNCLGLIVDICPPCVKCTVKRRDIEVVLKHKDAF